VQVEVTVRLFSFVGQSPHWVEHLDESVHHRCRLKRSSKCSPQWGDCPTNESIRLSMCDDACCDFSGQEIQTQIYRTSTESIRQSMCDDTSCHFLAKRDKVDIAHRPSRFVSRCAMHILSFSGQERQGRYRTSTESIRQSMCDDACCDFFWPRVTKSISHIDWRFASRCVMMHGYKNRYRTSTGESNRSMCDDACCDFSGQEIQNRYRTSIGESVDVR